MCFVILSNLFFFFTFLLVYQSFICTFICALSSLGAAQENHNIPTFGGDRRPGFAKAKKGYKQKLSAVYAHGKVPFFCLCVCFFFFFFF